MTALSFDDMTTVEHAAFEFADPRSWDEAEVTSEVDWLIAHKDTDA
jgi:hypothetical protein